MKKIINYIALSLLPVFISCNTPTMKDDQNDLNNGPRKVELRQNDEGQYRLYVNDTAFYVQGAGLEFGNRKALAAHGANSFRTWRTTNAIAVLDEAEELGLMVLMGIEVGRERHGFNYNDEQWVAQQKEEIRQQIIKLKDHPALLAWGIGNELNLRYSNKKVWDAVNDISKMIHEIDGNHPTTTMLAGIAKQEIDYMAEHCQDIDFLSVQLYGRIIDLPHFLEQAGYDGPYMVTEWGATGHWEVPSTEWGAAIEQSSTEKAENIKERYEKAILSDDQYCLGSYVFLWGQKQERTPTWYGLFTEAGEETEAIDVMHRFWNNGKEPKNRCPQMSNVRLNGLQAVDNIYVKPSSTLHLTYQTSDADNDSLFIRFEVLHESTDLKDGGDKESRPEAVDGLLVASEPGSLMFKAPENEGAYRVFLYVLDSHNHAATVNVPFVVR